MREGMGGGAMRDRVSVRVRVRVRVTGRDGEGDEGPCFGGYGTPSVRSALT